jgi:hypothetical protein
MGVIVRQPTSHLFHRGTSGYNHEDGVVYGAPDLLGDGNSGTAIQGGGLDCWIEAYWSPISTSDYPAGRSIVAITLSHTYDQAYAGIVSQTVLKDSGGAVVPNLAVRDGGYPIAAVGYNNHSFTKVSDPKFATDLTTLVPWTLAQINSFHSYTGPVTDNGFIVSEIEFDVYYSEPIAAMGAITPAAGSTVTTQMPTFTADLIAPQRQQPVRVRYDLSPDGATWPSDDGLTVPAGCQTYTTSFNYATNHNSQAYLNSYTSTTRLPQGTYYMRARGSDCVGTTQAWSATQSFTITLAALPVVNQFNPASGNTVNNPFFPRGGSPASIPSDGRDWVLEIQFSKDSTFATGVVSTLGSAANPSGTVPGPYQYRSATNTQSNFYYYRNSYNPTDMTKGSGDWDDTAFLPVGGPHYQYIAQGTWYARYRLLQADTPATVSAWSASQTFYVSHPPVAVDNAPTGGSIITTQQPLVWRFTDPYAYDAQTAYQVVVKTQAGSLIVDTGKVISSAGSYALNLPTANLYSPVTWTITVWDKDNVPSTSSSTNTFTVSKAPEPHLTNPVAAQQVGTGRPTVTWAPVFYSGATQKSVQFTFTDSASGMVVFDSGVITGTATSYTPPVTILDNNKSYTLQVQIYDSANLYGSQTVSFTTSYVSPPDVSYTTDVSLYGPSGYVLVDWHTTVADTYFIQWNVYRQEVGTNVWVLIRTEKNANIYQYRDYQVPSNKTYIYGVSQTADRSGYSLDSTLNQNSPQYFVYSGDYWLITPDNPSTSVHLYATTSDDFNQENESNVQIIMGRGRRVSYGTDLGISGTLTCKVRAETNMTASQQIAALRSLIATQANVYLRDPFGGRTKVSLGNIAVKRIAGVGSSEFADLTIPYFQVYA